MQPRKHESTKTKFSGQLVFRGFVDSLVGCDRYATHRDARWLGSDSRSARLLVSVLGAASTTPVADSAMRGDRDALAIC
jgi:hypothetical protein